MVEQIKNALTDSNIILAIWNDDDNNFELSQCKQVNQHCREPKIYITKFLVYKIEPFGETIYEPFGHWSSTKGLMDSRTTKALSQRRRNLRGKTIRASTVIIHKDSVNHLTDYR